MPTGAAPGRLPNSTDVLVVGGGIVGCSLAYWLAQEGIEVVVIDRFDLNTQASGANAGSLHAQLQSSRARQTDPKMVESNNHVVKLGTPAIRLWQQLAKTLDTDIEVVVEGGLMIAENDDDRKMIEAKVKRENALGLEAEIISGNALRTIAPYLSDQALVAEFCPIEGRVNPIVATPAIVRAAQRHGARFFRHTELLSLEKLSDGYEAKTVRGSIRCKRLVNAAGPGGGKVAAMAGINVPVAGDFLHMNVTEAVEHFVPHLVQHARRKLTLKQASNGNFLLGGGWPAGPDPKTGLPSVNRASLEQNLWMSIQVVPALRNTRLIRTWAGINISLDGMPLLGPVPGHPNFHFALVVTGYTLGPFCAQLVAAKLMGRAPVMDISPYSVERFG